jgi:hypothetical protein
VIIARAVIILVLLAIAAPGWAQASAQARSALSAEVVEVDDSVSLELSVSYDESAGIPERPSFQAPEGFTVIGPHVWRGEVRDLITGTRQPIFRARWQLVANKAGSYTLPAPTVHFDGRLTTGQALTLKVVPPGQGARERKRGFGGFGGFFAGPQTGLDIDLRDLFPAVPQELSPTGEELALARAPDPHVFLRIVPSKTEAVVGEQITLDYWAYMRGVALRHGQPREAPLVDFARMDLDLPRPTDVRTRVGGQLWTAQRFQRIAVFPLRTGKLQTGSIELDVVLPGMGRREIVRRSNTVVIEVKEPPRDGRPPGYELGDVGRFKLAATVSPRETVVGETVSVQVKVTGVGQIPGKIHLPKRQGVNWLDPEKKEDIRDHNGRVHGWRSFGYAVRFSEPGTHDLGALELPHYDPEAGAYEVARVELGKIRVKPKPKGSPNATDSPDEPDPLASLGAPRATLSAFESRRDDGLDPRWLWSLALLPPLSVVGTGFLARALSSLRERRRHRRIDPAALARRALGEAREAGDPRDAAAAAERALHLAIEARTGVKARGLLLADLGPHLRDRGLDAALADDVVALLDELGTARFAPAEESADNIPRGAESLVKKLLA